MRQRGNCTSGISPVVAVLLIVAITIILASVVSIWVFSFASETNEIGDNYLFRTNLDGSEDTIQIILMSGSKVLNSSRMKIMIGESWITSIPVVELRAGEFLTVDCDEDLIPGEVYHVKIVIDNIMMYEGDPVAEP